MKVKVKFNKHNDSWGIWTDALGGLWLTRDDKRGNKVPLKFQSKQEAARFLAGFTE